MKRKDELCGCCEKPMGECDCRWDSKVCYSCGMCHRHCICVGGPRSGVIYIHGEGKGFRAEVMA